LTAPVLPPPTGENLNIAGVSWKGEPVRFDERKGKFEVLIRTKVVQIRTARERWQRLERTGAAGLHRQAARQKCAPGRVIDKLTQTVEVGGQAVIDASKSYDPDKDRIRCAITGAAQDRLMIMNGPLRRQ